MKGPYMKKTDFPRGVGERLHWQALTCTSIVTATNSASATTLQCKTCYEYYTCTNNESNHIHYYCY